MIDTRKTIIGIKCHREGSDSYHSVIVRSAKYRVIVCKDNHQWIIQQRAGTRHGAPRWDGLSYCRGRNALIRLWTGLHRHEPPRPWPELHALPNASGTRPDVRSRPSGLESKTVQAGSSEMANLKEVLTL